LIQTVLRAYGITATLDESVRPGLVRFDLEHADYANAVAVLQRATKTFFVPLAGPPPRPGFPALASATGGEVLVFNDSQENRNQEERNSLQTFYFPDASGPTDLNDVATALRSLFDLRLVQVSPANSSISVRGPADR